MARLDAYSHTVDDGALCMLARGIYMGMKQDQHPFRCCPTLPYGISQIMCEKSMRPTLFPKYGMLLTPPLTFNEAIYQIQNAEDTVMMYRVKNDFTLEQEAQIFSLLIKNHYPELVAK